RDPVTHEDSFVLRLTPEFYPRFHLYVQDAPNRDIIFSLHLDQKKPSYGSGAAHAGEYSGPIIETEMRRIDSWVRQVLREEGQTAPADVKRANNAGKTTQRPWWWPF
ncbi:MAG: hypothetical protein NUV56_01080, partial [Candidatus Uhrbacteria bacterium]|nr:hypothetical protein [Candidatus Uhrbacteria bacterium]